MPIKNKVHEEQGNVLNDLHRSFGQIMLTSHKLLQQYWHDSRFDKGKVRVWYIDRGAPEDRSCVSGPDISLEPYYMGIRTPYGEKPVPYHRILLITYDGEVSFENQKIPGQANRLIQENQDRE